MNHIKRLIYFFLLFIGMTIQVFGGGQNKAGTAAAPELLIPIGSRYLAMSGAAIASVTGLESIFWNPAGLDLSTDNADVMFSYRQYIASMSMNYFAASDKFGFGTLGISLRNLNIGAIQVTTDSQPDGTGQVINPTYFVLGLSYSKALSDRISIGVNANWIDESWANINTTGFCFDFGVQYKDIFALPGLALGIAVKNLGGSLQAGGSGLWTTANDPTSNRGITYYEVGAASFDLPSSFSLGLAYSKKLNEDNKVSIAASYENNNYTYDNYRIGGEYSFKDLLFIRAGYLFSPQATTDTPNIYQNVSAGFGLNFESFTGINLSFDYAYVPVKYFDANNSFTIRMGF